MNEKTTTGFWPPLKERVQRTVEGIELIRKAWTSEDYFEHKGKHFRSFFFLYTKPEQPIPLLCAAQGPIMARNAGLQAPHGPGRHVLCARADCTHCSRCPSRSRYSSWVISPRA
jgi:Luciferase-like monooxygenase